ncbi:MAG: hypothetical protein IGS23_06300 [Rivularia sp. T60_A2020_040]|nr:hypothetical protein [Rivularia sp. T60_A2020_040]
MNKETQEILDRCDKAAKRYVEAYSAETALLFNNETSKDNESKPAQQSTEEPEEQADYSVETLYKLAQNGGTKWESKLEEIDKKFKELNQ